MEPIAVVGLSFRLPGGATDEASLWEVLANGRNVMSKWPKDRVNVDALYNKRHGEHSTNYPTGGHFLNEDPAVFDARFFSINANEAASMDPQHRWALETSYHAFENAGSSISSLNGSRMAVFASSMSDDYKGIISKDPDAAPKTVVTGIASTMLPNRLSWFYGLTGPSVYVDTACSGSLVALDLACQSLRQNDADSALVIGVNVMLSPDTSLYLNDMKFTSPDSVCWSFDHRANGYGRGEGIVALVLKPLSAAIDNKDTIRAIIRSTGSNQDGRTLGVTQPSSDSQERLIRDVYSKAGLKFGLTRYIEAHGTGTPLGDPIEMEAIGRVFKDGRSNTDPLYVGSIKANIGHLEAASGLAGIVKSILALERGMIPPNALFEKLNPDIDASRLHVKIPTKLVNWPTEGLRRISVNSFGFGGTNSHVILDDAFHFLRDHGLLGYHNSTPLVSPAQVLRGTMGLNMIDGIELSSDNSDDSIDYDSPFLSQCHSICSSQPPRLLVLTAASKDAVARVVKGYDDYYQSKVLGCPGKLDQLVDTLSTRRHHLEWRTYAVVDAEEISDTSTALHTAEPIIANADANAVLVFTGQGAQYVNMGIQLLIFPVFAQSLRDSQNIFEDLGCTWSILDAMRDAENINSPRYSQPLCTVLQIALFDLLKNYFVNTMAVVGHSSGEIAAAYASGNLSKVSALKVAYWRGHLAATLWKSPESGAMISVNVPEDEIAFLLRDVGLPFPSETVTVACVNSPSNCTLSVSKNAIAHQLKQHLDDLGVFSRILNTGVAYHSPTMRAVAAEYLERLGALDPGSSSSDKICMVSTVTGEIVTTGMLSTAQYWVDNLISPVQFLRAVSRIIEAAELNRQGAKSVTELIEIGPHSALQRPLQDIFDQLTTREQKPQYVSLLNKSMPSAHNFLKNIGTLFCRGHPVLQGSGSNQACATMDKTCGPALLDCPRYPFDHSTRYWGESRLSLDFRLREETYGVLLGRRSQDWNPLEPQWRNFFSLQTMPWLGDHVVSGKLICPGAGMIVMALEAAKASSSRSDDITGYSLQEAHFKSPLYVGETSEDAPEAVVRLRKINHVFEKETATSEVSIHKYHDGKWTECFQAKIEVEYRDTSTQVDCGKEARLLDLTAQQRFRDIADACTEPIDSSSLYGFCRRVGIDFGERFRHLRQIRSNGEKWATAIIESDDLNLRAPGLVHPVVLDASIQLVYAHILINQLDPAPLIIPRHVSQAWLAADGWGRMQSPTLKILSIWKGTVGDPNSRITVLCLNENGSVLCSIENLAMSALSYQQMTPKRKSCLLHRIRWQPQMSLLDRAQLRQLFPEESSDDRATIIDPYKRMELALIRAISKAMDGIHIEDDADCSSESSRYLKAMRYHLDHSWKSRSESGDASLDDSLSRCAKELPDMEMIPIIARNLSSLISGKTSALEVMFSTNLVDRLYSFIFGLVCDDRFDKLMNHITHENPGLRIFEVGVGTGGITQRVLEALLTQEQSTGCQLFTEYVYTDVSTSFFERARQRFSDGRIQFSTCNLEQDICEQGFITEAYDLVIAGSVIHATKNLSSTLENIRKLLRPGGRLINIEMVCPNSPCLNIAFGLLPGWFNSAEPWRVHSPLISEDLWNILYQKTGFSGTDFMLKDVMDEECHTVSLMVTTAQDNSARKPAPKVVVIANKKSKVQREVAQLIQDATKATVVSLSDVRGLDTHENVVGISLLELGSPFIASLTEETFVAMKGVFDCFQRLLWAASSDIDSVQFPYQGLMKGLLRTIKAEADEKHIVTLEMRHGTTSTPVVSSEQILKVLQACFQDGSSETEFVVEEGLLKSGRLVEDISLNREVESLASPQWSESPWLSGPPLELRVKTPGDLSSLHFAQDHSPPDLGSGEVEIEARVMTVAFRDVFIALGRLEGEQMGTDCAGIVRRVDDSGEGTLEFRPGDRCCLVYPHCLRTYPRAPAHAFAKIPDNLTLEDAVSVMNPGLTAYHGLINLAQLQRGETILIHSAAGSTGQMAIWIAKMVGAEVFATVGYDEKKELLVELGIPEDRIFYSRNNSFKQGIHRATNGRGVDVVLNSLSGSGFRASWECIAPFGRFVEIGKAEIMENSQLPMGGFAKNVSFFAVDLLYIATTRPKLAGSLSRAVLNLLSRGILRPPVPLHRYPLSRIEDAFRYMQTGKNTGRIILQLDQNEVVRRFSTTSDEWCLEQDASYLIVGDFGGAARSTARWLAAKGAKHLILLSRSGAASKKATALMGELKQKGVQVFAPPCDAASAESLSAVLDKCVAGMPPIKGCINAAMVLQDSVFSRMSFSQWQQTIRSKVETSLNLHNFLPQSLDFFLLLSSTAGIYGSVAQANYCAGNTFQDQLARYRMARGQTAVSIDLGWLRTIGVIAESQKYQTYRTYARDMLPIEEGEFLAVLSTCCRPSAKGYSVSPERSQLLVGAMTPSFFLSQGHEPINVVERPLFSGFRQSTKIIVEPDANTIDVSAALDNLAALFKETSTPRGRRAEIVIEALSQRIARILSLTSEEIVQTKLLADYGVDSLLAVEIRNWIIKQFGADVAVFDIMGGVTIQKIGDLVEERTTFQ